MNLTGKFTPDTFNHIETKFGISFPEEIKTIYTTKYPVITNDFTRTIRELYDTDKTPNYIVQISWTFATAIINAYQALTESEMTELRDEIIRLDTNKGQYELESSAQRIEYLLIEGPHFYDFKEDRFQISLIQRVYERLNRDHGLLKVGLVCWAHCGGWGHVIVRGRNFGCDGGGMHGNYLEVEHEGKRYAYSSNIFEHQEKRHSPGDW